MEVLFGGVIEVHTLMSTILLRDASGENFWEGSGGGGGGGGLPYYLEPPDRRNSFLTGEWCDLTWKLLTDTTDKQKKNISPNNNCNNKRDYDICSHDKIMQMLTLTPTLTLILTLPWTKNQMITLVFTLCHWRKCWIPPKVYATRKTGYPAWKLEAGCPPPQKKKKKKKKKKSFHFISFISTYKIQIHDDI